MSRCFDSSNALSIMPAMMKLCLQFIPLLNDDSAAVTLTVIFKDSVISINFKVTNSLLLSVKYFSGASNICIHDLRMTYGFFDLTKFETDYLVA